MASEKGAAPPGRAGPKKKKRAPRRTSRQQVVTAMHRMLALELRRSGHIYEEIGAKLGVHPSTAQRLVSEALGMVAHETKEEASKLRELELQRMDGLHEAMWKLATKGSPKAAMVCIHISKRRSALLGLDKIQVELDLNVKGYRIADASPEAFPDPPKPGDPPRTLKAPEHPADDDHPAEPVPVAAHAPAPAPPPVPPIVLDPLAGDPNEPL